VGYYGTSDVTWPRVGDVYYVRLGMQVVGNICAGGAATIMEIVPPPSTQLAISPSFPVYCYWQPSGGQFTQITDGSCPQVPATGLYGYRFNPTVSPYTWVVPNGAYLEIRVPVVSSQPLSGIAGSHFLYGAVSPALGVWSFPRQGVFVAPNDLIFQNGFEAGNMNAWTLPPTGTDGGDLSVVNWASMRGSGYGLAALVDDTNPIFVQDNSPVNAGRYRMRFYLNPYNFNPGESQSHFRTRVFLGLDETPQRRVLAVILRRQGGVYSLAVRVRRDDNSQADTSFFTINAAAHSIEIDFQRATAPGANNGTLRLWIDDVLRQTLSGIDNDQAGVDHVRMGALSVKTGATGTLLFDEMESRTTTAVGP
jgi:hypothetical protein